MKVFITGHTGWVGTIAVRHLHAAGIPVVGLAMHEKEMEGVEKAYLGSTTNYELLKEAMTGCDAVLHLAAYHMPFDAPEQDLFDVNVRGTFNVFKACAELGIKQITVASSPNAVGYNFGTKGHDLSYLPVDGSHPLYTTDPYSYSKECIESIGQYFHRRYDISSVFMRLGLDFTQTIDEWVKSDKVRKELKWLRGQVDELLALPKQEAARRVRDIENGLDAKRREAMTCGVPFKNGTEYVYDHFSEEEQIWNYYVHNLLMFLDSRDLGEAIVASLTTPFEGCHNVFIADHKNMLGVETRKLASLLYPGARLDYDRLNGFDGVVDYREAEKLFGWKAKYTVADHYDELYS